MKIIPGYRVKSRGLPAKTSSCGVQHDHEEKSSYAHDFLS
jgi:hypothetical protein